MIPKNIILALITVLLFSSCSESPTQSSGSDYFVFGWFYGECSGESCIEIFKIQGAVLYEDTLDQYPTQNALPHPTEYIKRTEPDLSAVNHIPGLIPGDLFSVSDVRIGMPDAADGGGFYVETNQSGEARYWLIDTQKHNIPAFLHAFTDSLDSVIRALQ